MQDVLNRSLSRPKSVTLCSAYYGVSVLQGNLSGIDISCLKRRQFNYPGKAEISY